MATNPSFTFCGACGKNGAAYERLEGTKLFLIFAGHFVKLLVLEHISP